MKPRKTLPNRLVQTESTDDPGFDLVGDRHHELLPVPLLNVRLGDLAG